MNVVPRSTGNTNSGTRELTNSISFSGSTILEKGLLKMSGKSFIYFSLNIKNFLTFICRFDLFFSLVFRSILTSLFTLIFFLINIAFLRNSGAGESFVSLVATFEEKLAFKLAQFLASKSFTIGTHDGTSPCN